VNDDRVEAGPPGLASRKVLDSVPPTTAPQLGRREVFTTLYKDDFIRVVGFVIKVGATVHEALDAAQAAFTQAWKEWDKIDKPSAWVRAVAMRAYFNSIPPHEVTTDIPVDRPVLSGTGTALPGYTQRRRWQVGPPSPHTSPGSSYAAPTGSRAPMASLTRSMPRS
jgi:hypothetical protein